MRTLKLFANYDFVSQVTLITSVLIYKLVLPFLVKALEKNNGLCYSFSLFNYFIF